MDKVVLQRCSYGVYIICSIKDGKMNGQIANTVFQITSDPPTVSISVNKQNLTHDYIMASKVFTVSILSEETPMPFVGTFGYKSGRDIDKFANVKYKLGVTGAPVVLENACGYFECEVINSMDVGTHTIFVGRVVSGETIDKSTPMTYEYYHKVKGGKSPKTAPTYVAEETQTQQAAPGKEAAKARYKCNICGYVYDPAEGDSTSGIAPGTAFEDLPDTWVCPVCGAPKSEFTKVA